MRDRKLMAYSAVCSAVGLLLIYFASSGFSPRKISLCELERNPSSLVSELVNVSGSIAKVSSLKSGPVILNLTDGGCQARVFFPRPPKLFTEGEGACVIGKVTTYEGETEITGDRLC